MATDVYEMAQERQKFLAAMDSMGSGTYKASGDIKDWTMYDRLAIDGTTPVLVHRLFLNGLGQLDAAGAVRNLADTNMVGRVGIPMGAKLLVKYIKIFYYSHDVKTSANQQLWLDMMWETTFDLQIFGKYSYGQWTMQELMNYPLAIYNTEAVANAALTNTVGRAVGVLPLELPIVLASQTSFEVKVEHHAAPNSALDDDMIMIGLCGLLGTLS